MEKRAQEKKDLIGVDVFLDLPAGKPDELGQRLQQVAGDIELAAIMNRGTKVWPGGAPETFCTDHWRCRFIAKPAGGNVTHGQLLALLKRVADAGFDFIKTENLYNFDGKPGYS
jgi:isocitrate dehydrogenase